MSQLDLFALIIQKRAWKNGALSDLANLVLGGKEITRENTDLTQKEWDGLFK